MFLALCSSVKSQGIVVPPVQERETDPQQIAEWCAGPKPGQDDQHRIVDGWDAFLKRWVEDTPQSYPELHFVRGKPITLTFRGDLHAWCWSAWYIVGFKNSRWIRPLIHNSYKDAADLVTDVWIYVRQGNF
jgi:hypothetical protein